MAVPSPIQPFLFIIHCLFFLGTQKTHFSLSLYTYEHLTGTGRNLNVQHRLSWTQTQTRHETKDVLRQNETKRVKWWSLLVVLFLVNCIPIAQLTARICSPFLVAPFLCSPFLPLIHSQRVWHFATRRCQGGVARLALFDQLRLFGAPKAVPVLAVARFLGRLVMEVIES